jgi:hypothetical protein
MEHEDDPPPLGSPKRGAMNTYDAAYARYLRTLERREKKRLRSAQWHKEKVSEPAPTLDDWLRITSGVDTIRQSYVN